ncbi:MAG: hypothetical protein IJY42_03670, partial [Clostridia bacterium]|nr:hypothetical protein [Clostridia bacterium]
MKKIIAIFAALLICSVAILPAFAEQTDLATDTEAAETVPQTETEPLSETTPTTDPALWQEMLDYLAQNGVDTSDFGSDTVEKLIALGEQFADLKEQGYTLEERLEQLVTPENILTTASAAVLVFSTVFLFIMKSRQRTATLTAARQMQSLRSAYDTEAAENAALRT